MTLGIIPETRAPTEDELEREEKFAGGRVVMVAVDHGSQSKAAFSWALDQFVTPADTLHLLHVLPKSSGSVGISCTSPNVTGDSPLYNAAQLLFDKLGKEAFENGNAKTVSLIREGDAGKEICAEALKRNPCAIIMGNRGLSQVKSLLVGSTTEHCLRHSPVPLIIVPHNYHASPRSREVVVEDQ